MTAPRAARILAPLLALAAWGAPGQPDAPVHHSLKVLLDPPAGRITVEDTVTRPPAWRRDALTFVLNSNLAVTAHPGELRSRPAPSADGAADGIRHELILPPTHDGPVRLVYSGVIRQAPERAGAEHARSFSETSGIISADGVYLDGDSGWTPGFGDSLVTFDLEASFAAGSGGWTAVSQGDRNGRNAWISREPGEEIFLVAADFTEYSRRHGDTEVLAWLRRPDPALAARYMDATGRYLDLYEPMLGEYPYGKFALVENFWETGYGMPSFTLLGSRVIRLPFILESSYPHEILHNWWGNGVYPDYRSGNWSEGLTAYLADHLFRDMDGAGREYRKDMLVGYRNYVTAASDFPLSAFTARDSAASQAVGYGKTLMLWHMLRLELGDERFLAGLRRLYRERLFRRASYADIAALFSEVAEADLAPFFEQWTARAGAPTLSMSVDRAAGGRARIMFAQIHDGEPYRLRVPVALYYEDEEAPRVHEVVLSQKTEGVLAEDHDRLEAVLADPHFDVFRTLDREEVPPTLGGLFGAGRIAFVLPAADRGSWTRMARAFGEGRDHELLPAEALEALPADRSVWILGRDNPFAPAAAAAIGRHGAVPSDDGIALAGSELPWAGRAIVAAGRHPDDPELTVGWIHADDMAAVPGLIEKLPHYGRYSYLGFAGTEPANDVRGVWADSGSPLRWTRPGRAVREPPPERPPLASMPPKYPPDRLLRHVRALTAEETEGRGLGGPGIERAAAYIQRRFAEAGLRPAGGGFRQPWRADDGTDAANIVGMIPGTDPSLAGRPLVVGAHYDHLGRDPATGRIFPGADDNASGVSVLIEVAAKLSRTLSPRRPVLFAAFSGEESGLLGSARFVREPPGEFESGGLFAMINLDAVGRLEGRPLQVFGADSAREWPFIIQGIGRSTGIEAAPAGETIASSDHVSFLNASVPAIHLFGGVHPDYHRPTDTADRLDLAGMSDVAAWLEEAVSYLAGRAEPLDAAPAAAPLAAGSAAPRAAGLGTVPDFAHGGDGVRLAAVTPGGPGDRAGLRAGDVLLRFNGDAIDGLQAYSDLIRAAAPGETVRIGLRRDGERIEALVRLEAR